MSCTRDPYSCCTTYYGGVRLCTALQLYHRTACKLGLLYSSCCSAVLGLLCTRTRAAVQLYAYVLGLLYSGCCCTRAAVPVLGLLYSCTYSGCCTRAAVLGLLYSGCCTVLTQKKSELIFSHSYNFYFGRESTPCTTMGAMAKFAHVTNRHKISYKLTV